MTLAFEGLEKRFAILLNEAQYVVHVLLGTTLMAVWFKALPLTASCLSPLPGFESWPGYVRKLPVTWR